MTKSPGFRHNNPWADSPYNMPQKLLIAGTTALGVAGSMALLAKHKGYSLAPKKMLKNIKNSWWNKVEFDEIPVITIGAGSCLGGLAGGCIVDKDKENRKAKLRETLLQIANISIPIIFVVYAAKLGKNLGKKYLEKGSKETLRTKLPKAIFGIGGLFAGVFSANIVANKINEKIFNRGKGRPVQASDFSAHLDDFCVAAQQIHDGGLVHAISRLVPVALMVAGSEVGNTCTSNVDS
ncbi:hypothetical protein IKQ21_05825 [bacterium]|nr:hypothetical protein [bacterium]